VNFSEVGYGPPHTPGRLCTGAQVLARFVRISLEDFFVCLFRRKLLRYFLNYSFLSIIKLLFIIIFCFIIINEIAPVAQLAQNVLGGQIF